LKKCQLLRVLEKFNRVRSFDARRGDAGRKFCAAVSRIAWRSVPRTNAAKMAVLRRKCHRGLCGGPFDRPCAHT
jgi:hypothetical protein